MKNLLKLVKIKKPVYFQDKNPYSPYNLKKIRTIRTILGLKKICTVHTFWPPCIYFITEMRKDTGQLTIFSRGEICISHLREGEMWCPLLKFVLEQNIFYKLTNFD